MLSMRQKRKIRKSLLKKYYLALLVGLLSTSTTGCLHKIGLGNPPEIEIWFINPVEKNIYRTIKGNRRETIPIYNNSDMRKFLVIDKREFVDYIHRAIEGCKWKRVQDIYTE